MKLQRFEENAKPETHSIISLIFLKLSLLMYMLLTVGFGSCQIDCLACALHKFRKFTSSWKQTSQKYFSRNYLPYSVWTLPLTVLKLWMTSNRLCQCSNTIITSDIYLESVNSLLRKPTMFLAVERFTWRYWFPFLSISAGLSGMPSRRYDCVRVARQTFPPTQDSAHIMSRL